MKVFLSVGEFWPLCELAEEGGKYDYKIEVTEEFYSKCQEIMREFEEMQDKLSDIYNKEEGS